MAALLEVTRLHPAPAAHDAAGTLVNRAGVTAGLAYINRCLRGHRPFAIVTGSSRSIAALMSLASTGMQARDDLHVIGITTPTDSVQAFLATCLAKLGFELTEAGLDDLHNLLVVFLRHEGARGRRTVVLIETTEHYGPRILEFMQTLSRVRAGATPAITFLLTGSRDLHRVLDSPGMAGLKPFTRERFDLDRSLAWVTPEDSRNLALRPAGMDQDTQPVRSMASELAPSKLIVMLDGVIIERRTLAPGRLVIGRSPQSGLRLDSRYVSRHHAALIITADSVTVIDLRSTNATLVNGQVTTSSQKLAHGDLVAIGNFRLRYDCRPHRR